MNNQAYNLSRGQLLRLMEGDLCWNEAILIGGRSLTMREYEISTMGETAEDALLLRKAVAKGAQVDTLAATRRAHDTLNLKLRHDVGMAKEDIANFIQETTLQLTGQEIKTHLSLASILGLSLLALALLLTILYRCRMVREAAKMAAIAAAA